MYQFVHAMKDLRVIHLFSVTQESSLKPHQHQRIHAIHHHVVRTPNALLTVNADVLLNIKEIHIKAAAQNVFSMMNAIAIRLVCVANVLIHVLEHVVIMHCVM